jgi:SAM-dependent methyltransferase/3-polyprenyl-4-hydroxybenzoate decarboxylase
MTEGRVVRAANPRVLLGPAGVFLFGANGEACALEGDHAALVLAVLDDATEPSTRGDLVERIVAKARTDVSQRAAVDQAIDLLVRFGALVPSSSTVPASAGGLPVAGAHVLVCVTGAIGVLATPVLVERLVALGYDVRVAMTRSARRFVTARAFEAITHQPALTSLWQGTPEAPAPHIELARWADVVAIYPSTATTIARLAQGDCSELVSAIGTTTRAPVVLAPSMNAEMLVAPAVAENLERLRERGFYLACSGTGIEVAEAPRERVKTGGVAAPPLHMVRYIGWLLGRRVSASPKLLSRAEWEAEHQGLKLEDSVDADILDALEAHALPPARVLDVGTGLGAVARAAAKRGHIVVATDFARRAIERARAVDPSAPVTWVVDDATASSIVGSFDIAVDRGCLGCIPSAARERYVETVASLVQASGLFLLKVHAAPARQIRAHGFDREAVLELTQAAFEPVLVRETTMAFGKIEASPALFFVLRRRSRIAPA